MAKKLIIGGGWFHPFPETTTNDDCYSRLECFSSNEDKHGALLDISNLMPYCGFFERPSAFQRNRKNSIVKEDDSVATILIKIARNKRLAMCGPIGAVGEYFVKSNQYVFGKEEDNHQLLSWFLDAQPDLKELVLKLQPRWNKKQGNLKRLSFLRGWLSSAFIDAEPLPENDVMRAYSRRVFNAADYDFVRRMFTIREIKLPLHHCPRNTIMYF
jgi:hypothetical protein